MVSSLSDSENIKMSYMVAGVLGVCSYFVSVYGTHMLELDLKAVAGLEFLRGGRGFDLNPHPQKMRVH